MTNLNDKREILTTKNSSYCSLCKTRVPNNELVQDRGTCKRCNRIDRGINNLKQAFRLKEAKDLPGIKNIDTTEIKQAFKLLKIDKSKFKEDGEKIYNFLQNGAI